MRKLNLHLVGSPEVDPDVHRPRERVLTKGLLLGRLDGGDTRMQQQRILFICPRLRWKPFFSHQVSTIAHASVVNIKAKQQQHASANLSDEEP